MQPNDYIMMNPQTIKTLKYQNKWNYKVHKFPSIFESKGTDLTEP